MVNRKMTRYAGWLPAVILPLAATDQLVQSIRADDINGVSLSAWFLFLIANLGSLVFAPKEPRIARLQVWIAFGVTSLLEVAIIAVLLGRGSSAW